MIDLAPEHLKTVKRILAEIVPDCEVRAFGSRATWTAKEHSDLDLVISSPEPLAWDRRSRLCEAFEESDLPIRVDVVDWESLSDGFRQSIDGDCVVLQERSTSGNWRETTLGEVIELKRGYDLPKRKRVSGSVPLISSSGTSDYHAEAKVMGPGVVTGRYGTLGQVYYIQDDFWPLNTTLYVRDFKGNNPRFISYLLRSIDFFAYSDKAAVPGVNRNHLHTAPVRIPPLDEQRRIAHILGTLDDKIELNRRMSQTLEAMAQALFKSWFVDFDPVRAKAEGRPTGLPPEIDTLFPDSFQDSELGEIPEGWQGGCLGDVAKEMRRPVKPAGIASSTPYISLAHMPQRSIALTQWDTADGLESGKSAFKRGEILFGKLRPYFHKVGIAPVDGVCSTDIVVAAPKSSKWFGFILGTMASVAFVDYTDAGSTGTRMPRTSWQRMTQYKLALPSHDVATAFTAAIRPSIENIFLTTHNSRNIGSMRDTLMHVLV